MKPKLNTRILKYLLITSAGIAVVYALIRIVLQGYSAPWTGFADFTKPNSDFVRGKTLWDWMQLFIIPIFLSIGVFLLNRSEREGERKRAEERAVVERKNAEVRAENERELAVDRQREAALQAYLDRMSDLLLNKKMLKSKKHEEVRDVARIRTLTALRGLDSNRKRILVLFLLESGLIAEDRIIDLTGADLTKIDLREAPMTGSNLSGADLSEADMTEAYFSGANLSKANLKKARLDGITMIDANLEAADLRGATMSDAIMAGTILSGAFLDGVDMSGIDLSEGKIIQAYMDGVNLSEAVLSHADFDGSGLSGADLSKADLMDANLCNVDLTGAKITDEQLATVKSLTLATMPDGKIHKRKIRSAA